MTVSTQRSARLAALPKAHLHVHLEGAARPATIAELGAQNNCATPDVGGFSDIRGFVECYRQVTDVICGPGDLARIIAEFVADEVADGVLYSEPMVGPWLYADRFHWSLTDTFTFIDEAFQQAARHHGIEMRYLIGVNWARSPEWIEHAAMFVVEHGDQNVAGLGFAGLEPSSGFERYSRAAAIVRAHGLLVVPHLGESQGPEQIKAALVALRPHRIAHGVRAADDLCLLRHLAVARIVCDICPTSNVRLRVTPDLAHHPLPTLLRHGVITTLNADDPLLMETTLTGEYIKVSKTFGFSDSQLADLAAAGTASAGMTETTRTRLRSTIRRWLADDQPTEGHHG